MKKRMKYIFAGFLTFIFTIMSVFVVPSALIASAQTTSQYTSPLEDLKRDVHFDEKAYPAKEKDYSLSVITVAESDTYQLFVYVYQPSAMKTPLVATSINLDTSGESVYKYMNYKLTLLSQEGVFQKYTVNGLSVPFDDSVRCYEISSIFRKWNSSLGDTAPEEGTDNTIDEVVFKVGKKYTFENVNDAVELTVEDIEVIEITSKYVGFVRYTGAYSKPVDLLLPINTNMDSHFVAFSTRQPIEKLLEADVYFCKQVYHSSRYSFETKPKEYFYKIEKDYAPLKYDQKILVDGYDFFDEYHYEWNRIQTVDEFIKSETITNVYDCGLFNTSVEKTLSDDVLEALKDKQWVLRFYESEYESYWYDSGLLSVYFTDKTIVSQVSILRLKFETAGDVYDLGVVDNKQTGSLSPVGNKTNVTVISKVDWDSFWDWLWNSLFSGKGEGDYDWLCIVVAIIGLFLLLYFLWPIVRPVFGGLFKAIFVVFGWILSLPVRLFEWLFRKR